MEWLAGSALIGAVVAAWGYVQWFCMYVSSIVVVRTTLDGDASSLLMSHFGKSLKRSPFGTRNIRADKKQMRKGGTEWHVFENVCETNGIFWFGFAPVVFARQSSSGNSEPSTNIYFVRGTVNLASIMKQAAASRNKQDSESECRDYVRVLSGMSGKQAGQRRSRNNDFDQVFPEDSYQTFRDPRAVPITCEYEDIGIDTRGTVGLSELSLGDSARRFLKVISNWLESKDWYSTRAIPWKLGARLVGPPGTGKTSFVRAIGREFNMPIFIFDLATMDNNELREHWTTLRDSAPAIALFEDFDGVFHGREQVNPEGELTFDAVLQCMSGADEVSGVLTFITTNKPECLDEAITRPGRAEFEIIMDRLSAAEARKIAERILAEWPSEIDEVLARKERWTGAEVQQECISVALSLKTKELLTA